MNQNMNEALIIDDHPTRSLKDSKGSVFTAYKGRSPTKEGNRTSMIGSVISPQSKYD